MPTLNFDNISRTKTEHQEKEESEESSSQKKQSRIFICEYGTPIDKRIDFNMSNSEGSGVKKAESRTNFNYLECKTEENQIYLVRSAKEGIKDAIVVNKEDLAISSILDHTGNNNDETDILEYCTPNYATNTSKLFSTKEKDAMPSNTYESEKMQSSDNKITIDINNLESFSLGPNGENLTSKRQSQQLVEELKSLQEQNRSYSSNNSDFVKEY